MYNYRGDIDAEDGNEDLVVSPRSDNAGKDLSDVEVVEKSNPKIQRRRVGTARGRVSATSERSSKRNSVGSTNKHQSQISKTPESSTKRTSVSPTNK